MLASTSSFKINLFKLSVFFEAVNKTVAYINAHLIAFCKFDEKVTQPNKVFVDEPTKKKRRRKVCIEFEMKFN